MSRGHGRQRRRSYAGRQRELRQRGPRPAVQEGEGQIPELPRQTSRASRAAAHNEQRLAGG